MSLNISGFVPDSKVFDKVNFSDGSNVSKNDGNSSSNTDSFLGILKSKLDDVNDKMINSENITEQFIKGDDVDVHEVMLAGEEAKMSLDLALQVRNKLIDAYQELNKTQI